MNPKKLVKCLIATLMSGLFYTNTAYAVFSQDDTLKLFVASDHLYESNKFRVADSVDPRTVTGNENKDDIVHQIIFGFNLDWKYRKQEIEIRAKANQNWFQRFDELDYLGWDTKIAWKWQIGSKFNGDIGYSNRETLGSFSELNQLVANLRNREGYFATANYLFHPRGRISIGVRRDETEFDNIIRQESNIREDSATLQLDYLKVGGTTVGFRVTAIDGEYPNRGFTPGDNLDNGYLRMNYALTAHWVYSPKTVIDGNVGYTDQMHDHLGDRDFDEITARLGVKWSPSRKLQFGLSGWREIQQSQNLISSFRLSQGVEFTPVWKPLTKVELRLPLFYEQQDFVGNTVTPGAQQQSDEVMSVSLNLAYRPWPNFTINTLLQYEKRDSNFANRQYDSKIAGINFQAAF